MSVEGVKDGWFESGMQQRASHDRVPSMKTNERMCVGAWGRGERAKGRLGRRSTVMCKGCDAAARRPQARPLDKGQGRHVAWRLGARGEQESQGWCADNAEAGTQQRASHERVPPMNASERMWVGAWTGGRGGQGPAGLLVQNAWRLVQGQARSSAPAMTACPRNTQQTV